MHMCRISCTRIPTWKAYSTMLFKHTSKILALKTNISQALGRASCEGAGDLPTIALSEPNAASRMCSAWRASGSASYCRPRWCKAVAKHSNGTETCGAFGPRLAVVNFKLRRSSGTHFSYFPDTAYDVAKFWRCPTKAGSLGPTTRSFASRFFSHNSSASSCLWTRIFLSDNCLSSREEWII